MNFFWKRKTSPEEDCARLTEDLKKALGADLQSVLLFGSYASGDYHSEHSDLNVLIVSRLLSLENLKRLEKPLRVWTAKGHHLPVLVETDELPSFSRSFPIEFLDMLDHHQMLYGADPLAHLAVDRSHLKSLCVHELALLQLKLRQAMTLAHGNAKSLRHLLTESVPSARAVFRSIVRLEQDKTHLERFEAFQYLAGKTGFEAQALERLAELRIRRSQDNLSDLTKQYLDALSKTEKYLQSR